MNKPIDWEQSMLATESSTRKAARLSERTITGLAEVLLNQRRHSQAVSEMKRTIAEMREEVIALRSHRPGPTAIPNQIARLPAKVQGRSRPFWRWLACAFIVGLAFGASIVSW